MQLFAALLADFLDPSAGPGARGDFSISPVRFVIVLAGGFALGVLGHLTRIRAFVIAGIVLILLATVLAPLFLALTG